MNKIVIFWISVTMYASVLSMEKEAVRAYTHFISHVEPQVALKFYQGDLDKKESDVAKLTAVKNVANLAPLLAAKVYQKKLAKAYETCRSTSELTKWDQAARIKLEYFELLQKIAEAQAACEAETQRIWFSRDIGVAIIYGGVNWDPDSWAKVVQVQQKRDAEIVDLIIRYVNS